MRKKELTIALLVSVLLHIAAFLFLQWATLIFPSADQDEALEIFLARPEDGWHLADISEPAQQTKPSKSKFLGMYDQSVKEETVARSGPSRSSGRGTSDSTSETKQPSKKQPKSDGDLFVMKSPVAEDQARTETGIPEDFYPDFKYGEHTYINVLRYPDVEYFVRLKRIFKTTWDPISAIRRDMANLSVSRGVVSCVVAVSVDKGGELSELFVLKSSGLSNYDNEAIRTVRASSPFTTPPEKFLEDDGVLRMSWTFMVYL